MTKLVIGKDRISVTEAEQYISGTQDAYKCTVTFSKDWEGLDRKLAFRAVVGPDLCDELYASVPAPALSMKITLPNKLFACPATKLQVSASATRKSSSSREKILRTPWTTLGRIIEGASTPCEPDAPDEPPPSVFDVIPPGGTKDQVMAKASDEDYDFYWMSVTNLPVITSAGVNAPLKTVMYFAGNLDEIPEGWALCDGQNGTPDLRGKIIVGATTDKTIPSSGLAEGSAVPINATLYPIMNLSAEPSCGEPGADGKSAYDIAVENGFDGTEEEWLASLQGKSAYDFAVDAGFTGTQEEFGKALKVVADIPSASTLTISSKSTMPEDGAGAYYFSDVTLTTLARSAIQIKRDYVYLDDTDPTKLRVTTLSGTIYDCVYAEDGDTFASIVEVEKTSTPSAAQVSYDDTTANLGATTVQSAIDTLAARPSGGTNSELQVIKNESFVNVNQLTSMISDQAYQMINVSFGTEDNLLADFSNDLVYYAKDDTTIGLYTIGGTRYLITYDATGAFLTVDATDAYAEVYLGQIRSVENDDIVIEANLIEAFGDTFPCYAYVKSVMVAHQALPDGPVLIVHPSERLYTFYASDACAWNFTTKVDPNITGAMDLVSNGIRNLVNARHVDYTCRNGLLNKTNVEEALDELATRVNAASGGFNPIRQIKPDAASSYLTVNSNGPFGGTETVRMTNVNLMLYDSTNIVAQIADEFVYVDRTEDSHCILKIYRGNGEMYRFTYEASTGNFVSVKIEDSYEFPTVSNLTIANLNDLYSAFTKGDNKCYYLKNVEIQHLSEETIAINDLYFWNEVVNVRWPSGVGGKVCMVYGLGRTVRLEWDGGPEFTKVEFVEDAKTASDISFDDTTAKLGATTVQSAVDTLAEATSIIKNEIFANTNDLALYPPYKTYRLVNVKFTTTNGPAAIFTNDPVYFSGVYSEDGYAPTLYTIDGVKIKITADSTGAFTDSIRTDAFDTAAPEPLPFQIVENVTFTSFSQFEDLGIISDEVFLARNVIFKLPDSENYAFKIYGTDWVKAGWSLSMSLKVYSSDAEWHIEWDKNAEGKPFTKIENWNDLEGIKTYVGITTGNVNDLVALRAFFGYAMKLRSTSITTTGSGDAYDRYYDNDVVYAENDETNKTVTITRLNNKIDVFTYDDTGAFTGVTTKDVDGSTAATLPFPIVTDKSFASIAELEAAGITSGQIFYAERVVFNTAGNTNKMFSVRYGDFVKVTWAVSMVVRILGSNSLYFVDLDNDTEGQPFEGYQDGYADKPLTTVTASEIATVAALKSECDGWDNSTVYFYNNASIKVGEQTIQIHERVADVQFKDTAKQVLISFVDGTSYTLTYGDDGAFTSWSFSQNGSGEHAPSYTFGDGLTESDGTVSVTTPARSVLTQTAYDALSEVQKNSGFYVVTDSKIVKLIINGEIVSIHTLDSTIKTIPGGSYSDVSTLSSYFSSNMLEVTQDVTFSSAAGDSVSVKAEQLLYASSPAVVNDTTSRVYLYTSDERRIELIYNTETNAISSIMEVSAFSKTVSASTYEMARSQLRDYSAASDPIIGRWVDKRPIYRKLFQGTVSIDASEVSIVTIPNAELVAPITGYIDGQNGSALYTIPGSYPDFHYGITFMKDTGEIILYASSTSISEKIILLYIDYVLIGDDELPDNWASIGSEGGTNDHTQLINRSVASQHPMSAISGLSEQFKTVPSAKITEGQIDALFS